MAERRVPQRYVVRVVDAQGDLITIEQAESLAEAREIKKSIEGQSPLTRVNYYKSESGLAILEGYMNELLR